MKHYTLTDYTNGEIIETEDVELFHNLAQEAEDFGYKIIKNSRMDWEIHYGDNEEPSGWDNEVGYNPYMGCYDWDC